jgi:hypothetical protein
MDKILLILLLIFSGYGAYTHFNKNKGEKIAESKLTPRQKKERANNKKLALLDDTNNDIDSSTSVKMKVPPQINEFVNNQMEQWTNLTPGEKNELRHLSNRIDQRLPFGNYERTLVQKLEDRNVFEAIRQNNQTIIKNTDNVVHETNNYENVIQNTDQPEDNYVPDPEPSPAPEEPIPDEPPQEEIPHQEEISSDQAPDADMEPQAPIDSEGQQDPGEQNPSEPVESY